jgi:UDP-N-acetylglucosamine 2-epimerase (non-hydrolysing)
MKNKLKWLTVAGARPNFMKIAPLIKEIERYNDNCEKDSSAIMPILVHTGQHYDDRMSKVFFEDLNLPKPDIDLGIGSASHAVQTAKIMIEFEKVCLNMKPDLVIVVGDVNSTMACSLVAVKLGIKVAHIEAGLRSFDRSMPEEINRIVTDSISDYLFTTCEDANKNLIREGVSEDKIYFVGNLMVDTLLSHKDKADKSHILETLNLTNGNGVKDYALLTLHRPSNVDVREIFEGIIKPIHELSNKIPVIFPAHLRTQKQVKAFGMENYFHKSSLSGNPHGIILIDPLGYLDFLKLMANAKLVLSDSGGIQEETTILGVPCLTLRENTERPITITEGTNTLVGIKSDKIISSAMSIYNRKESVNRIPAFWDGKSAGRIIEILIFSKDFAESPVGLPRG